MKRTELKRKARPPRSPMRGVQPRRDWTDARRKVDEEGECRVCHIQRGLQAAHVIGRRADQPKGKGKTLWVNPDSIVPLCVVCHAAFDAHELDLGEYLTRKEYGQAVFDAGRIGLVARRRLYPSEYRNEREAA